jgi:ParB family transcriptional regulator, chromosome partitioning protein
MKLEFLPLDKLHRSRADMRFSRKLPDLGDLLLSIRARGVLMPIIVRAEADEQGGEAFGS